MAATPRRQRCCCGPSSASGAYESSLNRDRQKLEAMPVS
jgi:hypothetical protein